MFKNILSTLLHGRNPEDMTCKQAREIVNAYYNMIAVATLGNKNKQEIEYRSKKALEDCGLGYFVV